MLMLHSLLASLGAGERALLLCTLLAAVVVLAVGVGVLLKPKSKPP
jgi:hypothetical protein